MSEDVHDCAFFQGLIERSVSYQPIATVGVELSGSFLTDSGHNGVSVPCAHSIA